MSSFTEIKPEELTQNTFQMIGKDWMLITSEKDGKSNTMTASWGGFGVMWGKPVAFIVVRPQRYTKEFIDSSDTFSLSFLGEAYRKDLAYLGKVSGRDEDKISKTGLTITHQEETPYFDEANTVVICKKAFAQAYKPESFIMKENDAKWYPEKDYHTLYIAEIAHILIRE